MSARPVASLSSGLLARPGSAKPAMRPQSYGFGPLDDLGWNDLGTQQPASPAPEPEPAAPIPPVLVERAELAKAVAPAAPATTKVAKRAKPSRAKAVAGHKAAFTLRLDADRHLRLRLASAVAGRSSQQLLVEALDAFLASQPQVETLARQVPVTDNKRFSGEKRA